MEKRLLIAFALSFFILSAWSMLFPPSKKISKSTQIVDIKQDIENKNVVIPSLSEEPISDLDFSEKTTTLSTDKLDIEFTNLGGNIKKATIKEFNFALPVENLGGLVGYERKEFKLDEVSASAITYVYQDKELKITKKFNVQPETYLIDLETIILNKSFVPRMDNFKISGMNLNMSNVDNNYLHSHARDFSLYEYAVSTEKKVFRKGNAIKFASKENKEEIGRVNWVSFRDRYFAAILKPNSNVYSAIISTPSEKKLNINLDLGQTNLAPGAETTFKATVFVGPQQLELLKKYNIGIEGVMSFSGFGLIDFVAKFIYYIMVWIHKIVPQWGLFVILLSVLVYLSMYPLTMKGLTSMKKMQAIQPKLTSLREQYKNNPQKLNKEVVELYKIHKVNPVAGCLPYLLQMPVFIALYQVLWRSVDLKGASFLWIKDLAEPDRLIMWTKSIPFIGNEFNVLPVVMAVIMFIQQKLTAKSMVITDEAQLAQQKMMATIFPVMLGAIFYKFASCLSLYFTLFYGFSAYTQWKISKQPTVV